MMNNQQVLNVYGAMAQLTEQMLAAARGNDWDGLVLLEEQCTAQLQLLTEQEPRAPMQGAERERKIELIRQMLTADRQIRDLTMPWMAQLSALISNTGTERRLVDAYGGV